VELNDSISAMLRERMAPLLVGRQVTFCLTFLSYFLSKKEYRGQEQRTCLRHGGLKERNRSDVMLANRSNLKRIATPENFSSHHDSLKAAMLVPHRTLRSSPPSGKV
jgi:hypothetical protein